MPLHLLLVRPRLTSWNHLILSARSVSTCTVLLGSRWKKADPGPVPNWANYDGNQQCEDENDDENRNKLIWQGYKRNFKGQKPPEKTRIRCIRGIKVTGNPCPICKQKIDIQYTDTPLLSQFICPHSGKILLAKKTGLCRTQQTKLEKAIEVARDHGLLPFNVPRKLPERELRTPPWNRVDIR